jgi:hypothetical protein
MSSISPIYIATDLITHKRIRTLSRPARTQNFVSVIFDIEIALILWWQYALIYGTYTRPPAQIGRSITGTVHG